jgi:hypothetical protein
MFLTEVLSLSLSLSTYLLTSLQPLPPPVTLFSSFFIGISVTLHPYRSPPLLTTAAAAPFFKASYTDAPTKDPLPGAACSNRGAFQTSLFKKYRPRAPSYKAAAAFSLAARLAM